MNPNRSPEISPSPPSDEGVEASLSPERIVPHLVTERIGRRLEILEEVDSTNSHLSRLAGELPDGAAAAAEHQSAGRGRHGRRWVSPRRRNLMVSILFQGSPVPPQILTLVGALAAVRTLEGCGVTVGLKWPNDVAVVEPPDPNGGWSPSERKVGGVLCEAGAGPGGRPRSILGIGLNINVRAVDFPDDLRGRSSSLAILSGNEWDRNLLLAELFNRIEDLERSARMGGGESIVEAARRVCVTLGNRVRVRQMEREIEGLAFDLDLAGRLMVRLDSGSEIAVELGEVVQTRRVE